MVKIDKKYIILQYQNGNYLLLKYEITIKDGSIVFSFPRQGISDKKWNWKFDTNLQEVIDFSENNQPTKKGHKITYHTSGRINYDNNYKIFSEIISQTESE